MATDNVIVLKGLGTAAGVPQEITGGHASGLVVGELAVNTTASAATLPRANIVLTKLVV